MVLGISEFDVEDTLDSMLNDIEAPKAPEKQTAPEIKNAGAENKLEISNWQLLTGRFSGEQIKLINEKGELPLSAKFIPKLFGGYKIVKNWLNIRTGTCILPFGYEVKKNIFGFTVVLPVGSKGLFIKK